MLSLEKILVMSAVISFAFTSIDVVFVQTPQSDDVLLMWIDVKGETYGSNDVYLPSNFTWSGMGWILITFDPDIDRNHQFWVLSEIKVEKAPEISTISWVKNIVLVRRGRYERLYKNPKFATLGIEYAIQRAMYEGNKPLEVIVYMINYWNRDAMIGNLTLLITRLGGEVLRVSPYKSHILARIPAQVIQTFTENEYVSEIYLNAPIVLR